MRKIASRGESIATSAMKHPHIWERLTRDAARHLLLQGVT
jgi:hypothetical protein